VPTFIADTYASKILARIASNMKSLGYERVGIDANPDIILVSASWQKTTLYYNYWFFWLGDRYSFSGYPVIDENEYQTGTLLMLIFNPKETNDNGVPSALWTGAINGLFAGIFSDARVNKSIDQAFTQSPYLITN